MLQGAEHAVIYTRLFAPAAPIAAAARLPVKSFSRL
jgi:hypothetical protein